MTEHPDRRCDDASPEDPHVGHGRPAPEGRGGAATPPTTYGRPGSPRSPSPATPAIWLRPGDTFGRYRIEAKLGQGGMGAVFRAHDTVLDRRVALKFSLTDQEDRDSEEFRRFCREARAAASLSHPGLCAVLDFGQVDGLHFLVMSHVEGETLRHAIEREAPLPQPRAAALVRRLALALDYAHARGVIHRDLKPSNVMLTRDGGPVVIDFGLARRIDVDPRLTKTGTILGTPHYMPPEQVEGDIAAMGPPGDIYSLGVILYELLTARRPFEGSVGSVLGKILYAELPLPSAHRPDLDPRLEAICRAAISRAIADRHASMKALADALGTYLAGA